MSLSRHEVEHIADLARLYLTEGERQRFEKELSAILTFVEKLNELDTTDVLPMTGGTDLVNVMRDDAESDLLLEGGAHELMEQASEQREGWVSVKEIFV